MVATSDVYFDGIKQFAVAARDKGAPCVVASVRHGVTATHHLVRKLELPRAALWKPEPEFCRGRNPGWRHTGVLKTQLILYILRKGFDCFIMDVDWRSADGFAGPIIQLRSSDIDIAAPPDHAFRGGHLINIGLLWMRNKPEMLRIAERVANRTYGAWDQLIFNQEVNSATKLVCCASYHLLQTMNHRMPKSSSLGNDLKRDSTSQEECSSDRRQYAMALPPPRGTHDGVYPNWQHYGYNHDATRCTSRCLACHKIRA